MYMKLKYFLPDWEDRLDPYYDFINDKYSEEHKRNPYKNDVYAHQLFKEPPYDGVLFSLSVFQSKISLNNNGGRYQVRGYKNIKDYLKIYRDSTLEVMGDCGAFGYVREKEPPQPFFRVENIANLYNELDFDYGVSVDHLVVDYILIKDKKTGKRRKKVLSKKEKDRRIKITLKNAKEFLKLHKKEKYDFIPIGVAQGYNLETYKNSVKALVEMGYEYIGIGGLVQYTTDFILEILSDIQPFIDDIKIHLFGVLRPRYLKYFEKLGVTSIDSASFFRKAWLRSGQNYLAPNGKWYTAIRVPHATDPRILKNADLNGFSLNDVKKMEKDALQALIKYDQELIDLDDVLDIVLEYDKLLLRSTNDGKNLRKKYYRTLLDMPWKTCNCEICKSIGIHVVIFRGSNRNKRRGFHNIWTLKKMRMESII